MLRFRKYEQTLSPKLLQCQINPRVMDGNQCSVSVGDLRRGFDTVIDTRTRGFLGGFAGESLLKSWPLFQFANNRYLPRRRRLIIRRSHAYMSGSRNAYRIVLCQYSILRLVLRSDMLTDPLFSTRESSTLFCFVFYPLLNLYLFFTCL